VIDDPAEMLDGRDPQLEAAVSHMLEELEGWEFPVPVRPPSPVRTGAGVSPQDF